MVARFSPLDVIYRIMTDRFSDLGIPAPQRHASRGPGPDCPLDSRSRSKRSAPAFPPFPDKVPLKVRQSHYHLKKLGPVARKRPEGPRGPALSCTARILKEWFRELGHQEHTVSFPSIRGEPLTRFAIHLLLRKTVEQARPSSPSLKTKRMYACMGCGGQPETRRVRGRGERDNEEGRLEIID